MSGTRFLTAEEIRARFPHASMACLRENAANRLVNAAGAFVPDAPKPVRPPRQPKQPNKTERDFGNQLEARMRAGEFTQVQFEGVTLRWAGMSYTPDWACFLPDGRLVAYECKGAHVWDDSKVKFKAARDKFPAIGFEMHQRIKGEWRRIL